MPRSDIYSARLNRCPLCGSLASLYVQTEKGENSDYSIPISIYCDNGGCHLQLHSTANPFRMHEDLEEFVDKWNTRAPL